MFLNSKSVYNNIVSFGFLYSTKVDNQQINFFFHFFQKAVTFFDLSQNFSTARYQKKYQQSEWQQIQTNVYAECD